MAQRQHDLPRWLWLYTPLAFLALLFVLYFADRLGGRTTFKTALNGELGVIENLTVVCLLATIGVVLFFLWRFRGVLPALLVAYLACFALGCLYFAGEEISWGQHYFGWETPEGWAGVNDQQETNLHNVFSIFDRVPKALVTLWVFVAGVIVPLRRPEDRRGRFWWFWPTRVGIPCAVIALLATVPEKLNHNFPGSIDPKMPVTGQELKECYFAFFFLTYVGSLLVRYRK